MRGSSGVDKREGGMERGTSGEKYCRLVVMPATPLYFNEGLL